MWSRPPLLLVPARATSGWNHLAFSFFSSFQRRFRLLTSQGALRAWLSLPAGARRGCAKPWMAEPTDAIVRMATVAHYATFRWRRPRRWAEVCVVVVEVAVAPSSVCMGAASGRRMAAGAVSASRDSVERAAASVRRAGRLQAVANQSRFLWQAMRTCWTSVD